MAAPTQTVSGIVLRKTKLGETDLILTMLSEEGQLLRCVAKGARKPMSTFASRLELFAEARLLTVKGKSLDIISECTLLNAHDGLRGDVVGSATASCGVEFAAMIAQEDLPNQRLYALTAAFLRASEGAAPEAQSFLLAGYLLKALAFSGLRPMTNCCSACGGPVDLSAEGDGAHAFSPDEEALVPYAFADGGPLCPDCGSNSASVYLPAALLQWVETLLHATFAEIAQAPGGQYEATAVLHFCQRFIEAHCGGTLKAMNFVLTCALPLVYPCETSR